MHAARDGAIWKQLAQALGDGLAFGVGVNLSNNAAARITPARSEMRTLADRLTGIEQRIEKARHNNTLPGAFQQKMVEAVVTVVDARLREQAAQMEKRVTDEIASLRGEMGQQLAATRQTAAAENDALRDEMTNLHGQFAESVARLVDEQITATVELRLAPVAERVQPMQDEVADLQRESAKMIAIRWNWCWRSGGFVCKPRSGSPRPEPSPSDGPSPVSQIASPEPVESAKVDPPKQCGVFPWFLLPSSL